MDSISFYSAFIRFRLSFPFRLKTEKNGRMCQTGMLIRTNWKVIRIIGGSIIREMFSARVRPPLSSLSECRSLLFRARSNPTDHFSALLSSPRPILCLSLFLDGCSALSDNYIQRSWTNDGPLSFSPRSRVTDLQIYLATNTDLLSVQGSPTWGPLFGSVAIWSGNL